jgi:hypothetical protein
MTILKTKDNLFYGQVKLATTIRKGVDEEWDEKTIYWYDSDGYITKKERETIYDRDITVFHYNSKKQLTERVEGEGDYQIIERYFYNSKGNIVESVRMNSENEIFVRNVYEYNEKGLKTAFKQYKGDGSVSEKSEYYYDNYGNLIKEMNHDYFKSIYIYDANHKIKESSDYSGGDLDRRERYLYDSNGNKTEQSVSQCGKTWITKYFYNELNQLIKSTAYKPDGSLDTEDTYKYDQYGNEIYNKYYSYNRKETVYEENTTIEYY